ncbi:MAG TPA: outer membrane beta-barrel protein [Bacteroidota bacterium]
MKMHRVLVATVICLIVCAAVSPRASAQLPSASFGITGGLAIPTGDFASTSSTQSGAAVTGFGIGANISISIIPSLSFVGNFTYISNGINEDYIKDQTGGQSYTGDVGSWTTLWPMVGVKYSAGVGPIVGIFLTAQGGLLLGTSPEVDITSQGVRGTFKSFSSSAFAYGFGGGVIIADKFTIELRILGGQPEYDSEYTFSGSNFTSTTTSKYDQPTGIIQLNAGIVF